MGGTKVLHERAPRSLADGCTFNVAATAALITNPLLFKTLPCDPAEDNVPVAVVARVVRVLGPSPPARGSGAGRSYAVLPARSIPARAGQPVQREWAPARTCSDWAGFKLLMAFGRHCTQVTAGQGLPWRAAQASIWPLL